MTRVQIMANRILPVKVVDEIINEYASEHMPTFEDVMADDYDEESAREKEYISPEKVQRMQPEDVVTYLANINKKYQTNDCDGILHVLAIATGRTEDDLRQAIFGTGSFDPYKFYKPTPFQKKVMRFIVTNNEKLGSKGIKWSEYDKWPQELKDKWRSLLEEMPEESWAENMEDVNGYVTFYLKNGIPYWLY